MHSKQFFRLSKSISFLWLSMHNSWIDSAERFSHTTFLHTKFARNWRHEPPGRTLPIAFSIGWQCTVNYHTSHNLNHMHEWTTTHSQRGRGVCFVYLSSSLFSLRFLSFFFCQYTQNSCSLFFTNLCEYMTRSSHVKGNSSLMHMHRQLCHQSCVAHDEFIGHGIGGISRKTRWHHSPFPLGEISIFYVRSEEDEQNRRNLFDVREENCRENVVPPVIIILYHTGIWISSSRWREELNNIPLPFWFHHRLLEIIYSTSFLLDKLQFALIIRYYQGYYIITG